MFKVIMKMTVIFNTLGTLAFSVQGRQAKPWGLSRSRSRESTRGSSVGCSLNAAFRMFIRMIECQASDGDKVKTRRE